MVLLYLLQESTIEKKMEEAPDSAYEIGVVIGAYLPLVALIVIAYLIYYHQRKKIKQKE